MIVLDASVLIGYLDAEDRHHRSAATLLAREISDDFAVSPITLAEVLVAPARAGRLQAVQDALDALDITTVALSDDAPLRLATLQITSRAKLPDCCVLLAAQDRQARLASFDERLIRAAEALGLTVVTT